MIRIPTPESSRTKSVGYADQVLEIEFRSDDSIWQYSDVPELVWEAFRDSSSKGKFFNNIIKKGGYIARKVG